MMHGIAIPHAVISSVARNLFHPLFPDFFAKPFMGNTVHLSAIRCFPFLAVRCSPSCRQRKRSLGSASDDDTGNVLFPHILCMMHGIAIPPTLSFRAQREIFSVPFFPDFFAKPFTGSTAPAFPRYGVSRFSFSNTRRLTANEKDPSTSLGMTIRETRHFPQILCMMHGIAIPHAVISSAARNLFRPSFPSSFAKPFTGSTAPPFRDTVFPISRRQTLSVLPPTKKIPRLRSG